MTATELWLLGLLAVFHIQKLPSCKLVGGVSREARLFVCGNGQGSPCLDLRRVPEALADATVGTDLVVIEGMGRAIHTNYRSACPLLSAALSFACAACGLLMLNH